MGIELTVRVRCKTEEYRDLYFELNQNIVEAFTAKGVQAPALRVLNDSLPPCFFQSAFHADLNRSVLPQASCPAGVLSPDTFPDAL